MRPTLLETLLAAALFVGGASNARAAGQPPSAFEALDGEQLYRAACVACHGADGKGVPQSTVGFETELPDFSDCRLATPEPDLDWASVIHGGGPARAFDRRMPAFGEALSNEAIDRVIAYLRGFCASSNWPHGDLNLPRALVTEKAFPENETVIEAEMSRGDQPSVVTTLVYERRVGERSQFEFVVPFELNQSVNGNWQRGLGDVAFAFKHTLLHRLDRGVIVSAGAEMAIPTGKELSGFGAGVPVFEPFLAFGQILPSDGFLQLHAGLELPTDSTKADKEAFVRAALGRSFMEQRFGRAWSPMVEVVGTREMSDEGRTDWDVVPQMQVTLSKRQHIAVSAGLRIPVNDRTSRRAQVLTYFLWDWFDGGLLDGWR